MNENKPTSTEVAIIEAALAACATYGSDPLVQHGEREHEPYIKGFKHSRTYKEVTQAITRLIHEAELRGRIDELEKWLDTTYFKGNLAKPMQQRIDELQAQLTKEDNHAKE